ncbi:hypothetical protein CU669_11005 [Paramagnetospirillum kuznetsovii]|uniref:Uncharacterized protein n=1 Tax=Paramagnetospirillum kuznetsovii TaxID=2053833 RepID=A0A364NY36_9PROT|nr:hypothetical protein [Paramagnetospirillum kuznetsovii]RAU21827.1 hypothetical protein CU669_11005 [Paramagnetospirillum kuznetsovii]
MIGSDVKANIRDWWARIPMTYGLGYGSTSFIDKNGRAEGNPHAWPVTRDEVMGTLFVGFRDIAIRTLGTDIPSALDHWLPGLGSQLLPPQLIKSLACRWGWSLWITASKPGKS